MVPSSNWTRTLASQAGNCGFEPPRDHHIAGYIKGRLLGSYPKGGSSILPSATIKDLHKENRR